MKTLKEAKIGETVTVVKLHGEGAIKRRIMDMGITKGVRYTSARLLPSEIRSKSQSADTSFLSGKPMRIPSK